MFAPETSQRKGVAIKIYSPNADYTGETAGVAFAAGVADISKEDLGEERYEGLKSWFEQHGFGMGSRKDADDQANNDANKGTVKNLSQMGREELNEAAVGKGILGAADMKNMDEVRAAIEAAGGADSES